MYILACHNSYHGVSYRKKRAIFESADDTEISYETYEYNVTALINYFTECMIAKSKISLDWYSATEWTINESNWFYFTDNNDCAR